MLSTFLLAVPAVLFIVDPIGVLPLFVAMTANDSAEKCRAMALRASVAGFAVLAFFALFGGLVFKVFGITLPAFRVAGGLLLMLTALDMLRARRPSTKTSPQETREGVEQEDIAIVPMAMPLLAGPGAIAMVMVLMSEHGDGFEAAVPVLAAIALTFVITYVLLRSAAQVKRVLKLTGIAILERVFGLILAAIAVQFVVQGTKALIAS